MNKVNFDIIKALKFCSERIEKELNSFCKNDDACLEAIVSAQRYSLLGGGKRIRPYLVLTICRIFGGDADAAIPWACALEMIHTYSLIHDDLPCMDNDDYRRGRLTNHKVYGEAIAVLAGDALLTKAFGMVAGAHKIPEADRIRAVSLLAAAAGDHGMIGGQTMDMMASAGDGTEDEAYLVKMHGMKTGALIIAAAKLGAIASGAGAESPEMLAAEQYAKKLGLAFQIVDDVLDVIGDPETLGKNVGVDNACNKMTFTAFYSVEKALAYAEKLTEEAVSAIRDYDTEGELAALARYLLARKN